MNKSKSDNDTAALARGRVCFSRWSLSTAHAPRWHRRTRQLRASATARKDGKASQQRRERPSLSTSIWFFFAFFPTPRCQPTSVAKVLLPAWHEASSRAIWRRCGCCCGSSSSSRRGACRTTGVASRRRRHCCCRRRCCSIASSSALGSREAREEHGLCVREIDSRRGARVREPR